MNLIEASCLLSRRFPDAAGTWNVISIYSPDIDWWLAARQTGPDRGKYPSGRDVTQLGAVALRARILFAQQAEQRQQAVASGAAAKRGIAARDFE